MRRIKDPISLIEVDKIIKKDIERIKRKFSYKGCPKSKGVYKIKRFCSKNIRCGLGKKIFKRSYLDSLKDVKVFLNEFKKKKCSVECTDFFTVFVCSGSICNYVNLKIIFHIYE